MKKLNWTRSDGALLLTVVLGLASVLFLSRWLDTHRWAVDPAIEEEKLYLNAAMVKQLSLGFKGLAADWYWMRSLQYVGRKILNSDENLRLDNLSQLNLRLLVPLLETATTLDPQFMEPYQYTAAVLPEIDVEAATRIIKKGIEANPTSWRLYHHLGYIYWQQKDFSAASKAYGEGAKLPDAPPWMVAMEARMLNKGGSRDTARAIYQRMYEEASEDSVKNMAKSHLLQLDLLDERDALHRLLIDYKSRTGRCPESWREMGSAFRLVRAKMDPSGALLDPFGKPYRLVKDKCDVDLDPRSGGPLR
jgi:tetratricopeptide (TPR) repeat protein